MLARLLIVPAVCALVLLASSAPSQADSPITFNCTLDANCPAITVAGDPFAEIGGSPSPFRGYGDPSLEYDPSTGTLWLTYSWLDLLVSDPGPPPVVDSGVRTHLASSTDGGLTWTYEKALNETLAIQHPDTGEDGWTIHEVSSLLREGPSSWQAMWFTYFDPFGVATRKDFYLQRSLAATPTGLDASPAPWIRGNGTSPSFGAAYNLSDLLQLSDCVAFTEPALFADGGHTYLALNCIVYSGNARQYDQERLVLLREEAAGYSFVGTLLDYADAVQFGGTTFEQADLSYAKDGGILLIATPIDNGGTPEHQGCVALEVTDLASAAMRRDGGGDLIPLALITADDDSIIGPGACTYDAASETGVLMHVHEYTPDPFDMQFTVRATGIDPVTSQGDPDDDGWSTAAELLIGTNPDVGCGYTAGGDPASENWPADLIESNSVTISDVLALKPVFNATVPPVSPRYDLAPSGSITISDVLSLKPVFNVSCAP